MGLKPTKSPHGEKNFILFIDDFSRMCWIGLLKHKDEAFKKFKAFKALFENEPNRKIKCLRSDRGGEFTSDEFFDFCEQHGIKRQFSTARTPQPKWSGRKDEQKCSTNGSCYAR